MSWLRSVRFRCPRSVQLRASQLRVDYSVVCSRSFSSNLNIQQPGYGRTEKWMLYPLVRMQSVLDVYVDGLPCSQWVRAAEGATTTIYLVDLRLNLNRETRETRVDRCQSSRHFPKY